MSTTSTLNRSRTMAALVAVSCLGAASCNKADQEKWDKFWKVDSGGHSLFGKHAGDTESWTIECNEYRNPNREERERMADSMATLLKKCSELRADEVWVQHDADRSRVFYGHYSLTYVTAKTDSDSHAKGDVIIELDAEIRRDLDFIRKLALGDKYPFFSARPIAEPSQDVGPPEWDLRKARGVYTLNVGVTYNTSTLHNYKEAAVEWVRDLRRRGYEGYYYHDPERPISSVCVGTFGDNGLVDDGHGKTRMSDAVLALRNKEEFKYNLENGHIIYRMVTDENGKRIKIPNWSFLGKIPRQGESGSMKAVPTEEGRP